MTTMGYLAIGIGLVLLAAMAWWLASRHGPCPVWLRWLVELDNPFTRTNRAHVIIEHLSVAPGMYVLDVGCGPGRLTIPLARAVGENGCVVAIDVQTGMLERARARAEAAKLTNIRFVRAAIEQGRLERDRAYRAVLVTVLGEIPDRAAALGRDLRRTEAGRDSVGDGGRLRSALSTPGDGSSAGERGGFSSQGAIRQSTCLHHASGETGGIRNPSTRDDASCWPASVYARIWRRLLVRGGGASRPGSPRLLPPTSPTCCCNRPERP